MRRTIRAKLTPPSLPGHVVERPRLEEHLAALLGAQRVVWVCGTAGAGKTTAVLCAARRDPRPLRWLTVDSTDRAAGRLLTYLDAALQLQDAPGETLAELLADGLSHAEVAGLLADDHIVLLRRSRRQLR